MSEDRRQAAKTFYERPPTKRKQEVFDFGQSVDPEFERLIRSSLEAQFHGKCAYCESLIGTEGRAVIDWFRPRGGVAENSGDFLPDHYWAQAYEWENLYFCCATCNRSKGNRFPVDGIRASADADRALLAKESTLLLDPCLDRPQEHLIFTPDGRVSGATLRGRITIELLDLNREGLIGARQLEAVRVNSEISSSKRGSLKPSLDREAPYLAVRQMIIRQHKGTQSLDDAVVQSAVSAQQQFDASREAASTASEADREQLRARARHIERVEIRNITSISHLTLDLSHSKAVTAPCFALLGENGIGKTTILECISLALAGPHHRADTGVRARDFLRSGEDKGYVRIHITGFTDPVEMTVTRNPAGFKFKQEKSRTPVLAYGASRLLPTPRHPAPNLPDFGKSLAAAKITNLFDPYQPLTDIAQWLRGVSDEHFDDASTALQSLLPGRANTFFVREKDKRVTVRSASEPPRPFESLSDGYQSMLGLAADIMEIMYSLSFASCRAAQGIVLIDELGNHLHPAWRMRIVSALRTAFPQVQFIFSTHDPLCLKGLRDGEVAVIRRDRRDNVYALENLPSMENMRVDQLLTSEHFGLDSTLDPDTDKELIRYRELCRLDVDEMTEVQRAERDALSRKLSEAGFLGRSWRERLLLEALEQEVADLVVDVPSLDARELNKRTVERLRRILAQAKPEPPPEGVSPTSSTAVPGTKGGRP